MSGRAGKDRQKAKRAEKRAAAKRRASTSPVKRLADAPGPADCWMTREFETLGQIQIFVHKRAGTLAGVACFLIDRGVVGLKDAWVRMNVGRDELQEMLDTSADTGLRMHRATPEVVRRWVAGAARWAHDNGMRLPKDWNKPASLIGGVGDWASADVSPFVKEFAGHPEDLRQRLVAEPFESYVKRRDITFDFDDSATYKDQATGQYVDSADPFDLDPLGGDAIPDDLLAAAANLPIEEINEITARMTPAAATLVEQTSADLAARGQNPSPELLDAWRSVLVAHLLAKLAMPDAAEQDLVDFTAHLLEGVSGRIDPPRADEHDRAVDQALDHLERDPAIMQRAVMKHGLT